MARARNIKPGIMANDILAECHYSARLLFIYLWMLADRDGRLEDKPRKIRAQAFPYDEEIDVDFLLNQLNDRNFIQRYEVEGIQYIQIVKFTEHQTPHVKEKTGTIPAPDKHQTSTRQVQCKTEKSTGLAPPDSLIVDTGLLNVDTGSTKPEAKPIPQAAAKKTKTKLDEHLELPDDWKQSALDHWQKKNRPDLIPEEEFEKFKSHHVANGSRMEQWSAAWRTWYSNAVQFTKPNGFIQPAKQPYKPQWFPGIGLD